MSLPLWRLVVSDGVLLSPAACLVVLQDMVTPLPKWVTAMFGERSFAWVLLWIACVVSVIILALQIAIPGSA